jgi:hypothetical protein
MLVLLHAVFLPGLKETDSQQEEKAVSSAFVFGERTLPILPIFSSLRCAYACFSIYSAVSDGFRLCDFSELGLQAKRKRKKRLKDMKRQWEHEELVEHWTLDIEDRILLGNKTGATRLGFAVLLKFFQHEGRFPPHKNEVPGIVITFLATQVGVAPEAYVQ